MGKMTQIGHLPYLTSFMIVIECSQLCTLCYVATGYNEIMKVQSRQGCHRNPIQNPTKYTWHMMIALSVKVLFPILGAHSEGLKPPR